MRFQYICQMVFCQKLASEVYIWGMSSSQLPYTYGSLNTVAMLEFPARLIFKGESIKVILHQIHIHRSDDKAQT